MTLARVVGEPGAFARAAWFAVVAALAAAFGAAQAEALAPYAGDEGIYFYLADAVAGGRLPHRDFFFAHPLLHLAPGVALRAIGAPDLVASKLLVLAFALTAPFSVAFVVRKVAPDDVPWWARDLGAVAAATVLVTTTTFVSFASRDLGVVQATALVTMAAAFLAAGRPSVAGALAAASVTTALQVVSMAVAVAVAALTPPATRRRFLVSCAVVLAIVHIVPLAFAGRAFLEQVYLFHLRKVPAAGEVTAVLRDFVASDWPLLAAAAWGGVVVAVMGGPRRPVILAGAAIVLHAILVGTRPRAFRHYLLPILPAAAVVAGVAVAVVVGAWRRRASGRGALAATGAAVALAAALASPRPFQRFRAEARRVCDACVAAAAVMRATAEVCPATALLGDPWVTPLVALLARVPVVEDLADIGAQPLAAGAVTVDEIRAALARHPDAVVLTSPRRNLAMVPPFRDLIERCFVPVREFPGRAGPPLVLHRRTGGCGLGQPRCAAFARPADGPVR